MVGDSRRSRRLLNWRNILNQYWYKRLEESSTEDDKEIKEKEKEKLYRLQQQKYKKSRKKIFSFKGKGYLVPAMSDSVKAYIQFLRGLSQKSPKKRKIILKEFGDD